LCIDGAPSRGRRPPQAALLTLNAAPCRGIPAVAAFNRVGRAISDLAR
jgi:hypothetical protein